MIRAISSEIFDKDRALPRSEIFYPTLDGRVDVMVGSMVDDMEDTMVENMLKKCWTTCRKNGELYGG